MKANPGRVGRGSGVYHKIPAVAELRKGSSSNHLLLLMHNLDFFFFFEPWKTPSFFDKCYGVKIQDNKGMAWTRYYHSMQGCYSSVLALSLV